MPRRLRPPPTPARADRDPLRWLHECTSRPVDVVMIGDSNQLQDGQGFERGLGRALAALSYPIYATPIVSQNENGGAGNRSGMYCGRSGTIGAVTGAPAELSTYWANAGLHDYAYGDDSYTLAAGSAGSLIVSSTDSIWPMTEALQYRFGYGTFPSGTGRFQFGCRWEASPFTVVSSGVVTDPVTGSYGHAVGTLAVAADSGRSGLTQLAGKWTINGGVSLEGPYFGTYCRAVLTGRVAGWSVHSLYAVGGVGLRTYATTLQGLPAATWATYWAEVRHRALALGRQPRVVVYINSGLNDRNDSSNSVGPSPAVSSTAAGFADNLTAIKTEIEADYPGDLSELSYWIVPSHASRDAAEPTYDPDETKLIAYRTAAASWAAALPNARATDLAAKMSSADMLAAGYYKSGGTDRAHLVAAGYLELMTRALQF